MLAILTWNINSIRKRIDGLARLAEMTGADVICLQETKVDGDFFPTGGNRRFLRNGRVSPEWRSILSSTSS